MRHIKEIITELESNNVAIGKLGGLWVIETKNCKQAFTVMTINELEELRDLLNDFFKLYYGNDTQQKNSGKKDKL